MTAHTRRVSRCAFAFLLLQNLFCIQWMFKHKLILRQMLHYPHFLTRCFSPLSLCSLCRLALAACLASADQNFSASSTDRQILNVCLTSKARINFQKSVNQHIEEEASHRKQQHQTKEVWRTIIWYTGTKKLFRLIKLDYHVSTAAVSFCCSCRTKWICFLLYLCQSAWPTGPVIFSCF